MTPTVPWKMCEYCHERGKRWPYNVEPHGHDYIAYGTCGQCGEPALLVECHTYDFRKPSGKRSRRRK